MELLEFLAGDARMAIQTILAGTLCIAAFIWGDGPEKAMAGTWIAAFELPVLLSASQGTPPVQLTGVDQMLASTDVAATISFVLIALYANRNYTLWIASVQLLALAGHFARGFEVTITPFVYCAMVTVPGWLQLFLMAIGLGRHIKRKMRFGAYKGWSRIPLPLALIRSADTKG